jgi:hypothetical protein
MVSRIACGCVDDRNISEVLEGVMSVVAVLCSTAGLTSRAAQKPPTLLAYSIFQNLV